MQQEAMATLYSPSVLADLNAHSNEELQQFFHKMAQEKYHYMHHFFGTLQQRKVIRDDFPITLIDVIIQKIDEMLNTPTLQQHYIGNEQQLLKDILQFFMHGIAYQKRRDENVLPSKTWTLKPNLFKVQIFYRQILLELKHYIFKLIVLNTTSEKIGMLKPKHSIYDNFRDIKILVKKSEY